MKAKILVELEMPYDRSRYEPLIELSESEFYSKKEKVYKWIFRLDVLPQVIAVLNKEIEFDEIEVNKIISRCPSISQEIEKGAYKGKGFIDVVATPKLFLVTNVINKKISHHKIPVETVNALWVVIKKQPLNRPVKTRTVSEHYCNKLGIMRFHRTSGTFDFEKFFGTRNVYIPFNLSLKILENYGLIFYHKHGAVERKKESWDIQSIIPKEVTIKSTDL